MLPFAGTARSSTNQSSGPWRRVARRNDLDAPGWPVVHDGPVPLSGCWETVVENDPSELLGQDVLRLHVSVAS
jgi:hypothetical protein